jgi:hypothetical protein
VCDEGILIMSRRVTVRCMVLVALLATLASGLPGEFPNREDIIAERIIVGVEVWGGDVFLPSGATVAEGTRDEPRVCDWWFCRLGCSNSGGC